MKCQIWFALTKFCIGVILGFKTRSRSSVGRLTTKCVNTTLRYFRNFNPGRGSSDFSKLPGNDRVNSEWLDSHSSAYSWQLGDVINKLRNISAIASFLNANAVAVKTLLLLSVLKLMVSCE